MRNAVWALSNLCRGKNPPPDFTKVICQDKYSTFALVHFKVVKHTIFYIRLPICHSSCWKVPCFRVSAGLPLSQRAVLAAVCQWHRHSGRCVLGAIVPIRWSERQNPGCHWLWSLSQAGGVADVRLKLFFLAIQCLLFVSTLSELTSFTTFHLIYLQALWGWYCFKVGEPQWYKKNKLALC